MNIDFLRLPLTLKVAKNQQSRPVGRGARRSQNQFLPLGSGHKIDFQATGELFFIISTIQFKLLAE